MYLYPTASSSAASCTLTALIPGTLRLARVSAALAPAVSNSISCRRLSPQAACTSAGTWAFACVISSTNCLVFGADSGNACSHARRLPFHFPESADASALRATFSFTLRSQFLSLRGPKTTPPPFHFGERIEPRRGRPPPIFLP